MTVKYQSIPSPVAEAESLRATALATKEVVEAISGQRGSYLNAAVTWQDLVNLGLITLSQVPVRLGNR